MSDRIKSIYKLTDHSYQYVWDLCCDHGLIGMQFLNDSHVYFVDRVDSICNTLTSKLEATYITQQINYDVLKKDMLKTSINNSKKNLLILSGIGGELIIKFLKIHLDNPTEIDYLLCSHQNTIELRSFLNKSKFKLIDEKLIKDNGKFYELIYLSNEITKNQDHQVHIIGSKLWDDFTSIHQDYLNDRLEYLNLRLKHTDDDLYKELKNQYTNINKINMLN